MVGRYVTIVIPGEKKVLTLCEVEVYGVSVLGRWKRQSMNPAKTCDGLTKLRLCLGNQNLTELQLVGSNLPYQGHLLDDGTTFCDSKWSSKNADVACIQLGYPGINVDRWNDSYFGNIGSLPEGITVKKRYNCSGAEGSLKDCPRANGANEACTKQNAISLTCK